MDSKKLKAKRIVKGYTQQIVAEMLELSITTYMHKENGKVQFTSGEVLGLAIVLDLTLDDVNELFFGNKLTKCISGDAVCRTATG